MIPNLLVDYTISASDIVKVTTKLPRKKVKILSLEVERKSKHNQNTWRTEKLMTRSKKKKAFLLQKDAGVAWVQMMHDMIESHVRVIPSTTRHGNIEM